ncbi:ribbon-helix-helix domain-containing protein [candidate division KSB1 bacterium]|nr:ribbon-helix-helix domain-containing protein [candidate division KSB1 bacterium]
MQVKTSITLSGDLLHTIDELIEQLSEQYQNRSAFLEMAAWAFIEQLRRAQRTAKDIEIINRRADDLNKETMDALAYQNRVASATATSITGMNTRK